MEFKAFNRWSTQGIVVEDMGLKNYITLTPTASTKSGGRNQGVMFRKSKTFIVERLVNKIMVSGHKSKKHLISSGHNGGKGQMASKIVEKTFTVIEQKTKKNPVEVFVKGLVNAAPREEIITIEYGGARYPKSVECAPQRRVDIALRQMVQGSYQKSFNNKKNIIDTLSDEIINAYMGSPNSAAIAKKNEVERQADSSR